MRPIEDMVKEELETRFERGERFMFGEAIRKICERNGISEDDTAMLWPILHEMFRQMDLRGPRHI